MRNGYIINACRSRNDCGTEGKKVLENIAEMIDVMAERISYGFYNDEDR